MPCFDHRPLRPWRLAREMRLEEAAYRSNISYMYLRALEAGTARNPSIKVLTRLAAVYGHNPGELFTTDDPVGAA